MQNVLLIDLAAAYINMVAVFEPKILKIPCVILGGGSNLGCVVALNDLAKGIGIKRGDPYFKIKHLLDVHNGDYRTGNMELFGCFSRRFFNLVKELGDNVEQYSIDECFFSLHGFDQTRITNLAIKLRSDVLQGLGLPSRVGIGSTKLLAKLANACAKAQPEFNGICNFNALPSRQIDAIMAATPVSDTWGIGSRLTPKLNNLGIHSILDLKNANPKVLRRAFSVGIEKIIRELNGELCIELEDVRGPKQQIIRSRSFGHSIMDIETIGEAVAHHISTAALHLREQKSFAQSVTVYICTSPFRTVTDSYRPAKKIVLPSPTDNTLDLVKVALWGLKQIYRPGHEYVKAGIMLGEIITNAVVQVDLFSKMIPDSKSSRLMSTIDAINGKMGKSTIRSASEGFSKDWQPAHSKKVPSYTTNWNQLLSVD